MKRLPFLLFLGVILKFSCVLFSQTESKKFAVGLYTGVSDYYGELDTRFFNIDKAMRVQVGGTFMYWLNPYLHTGIDFGYGGHGQLASFGHYRAKVLKFNGQIRLMLNQEKWIALPDAFQPYIFAGLGFTNHFLDLELKNIPGADATANLGFGLNYRVNSFLSINYNTNWAITTSDERDLFAIPGTFNDMFMIHSIGIVVPIAKVKDTDGDGVHDGRDRCPNTPFGVEVDMLGCPFDRDEDGVADYQDLCADVPGFPSAMGCPDADDDGIPDYQDACPDTKGSKLFKGCPDTDGDGIPDAEDDCVDVVGLITLRGCPDRDGDGIEDSEDDCPDLPGKAQWKGCPDTDGDGVIDPEDDCPRTPGVKTNRGCPEIAEATKKVFEKALRGIQFETAKATIKKVSLPILNEVVAILQQNPTYLLLIEGHTDDQGEESANQKLSEERANSVRNYLIYKGIDPGRLTAKGYGESMPVADNSTETGRALNRRVAFTVRFEE